VKSDVPEPGAAIDDGLKLPVTPEGSPVADKAIAALKPPETDVVTTAYPLWPLRREPDVGETEMVKVPLPGAVTVSRTVAVWVIPPPVPVITMVYAPAVVVAATTMVIVEVPEPVMEVGLKVTVTPAGWPLADSDTAELKPSMAVDVMVEVALPPWSTVKEAGEAERVKVGLVAVGARALIRFWPFGLPQPVTRSNPVVAE